MLVVLGCGLCQAQWQNRQLLTGFSSAHDLLTEHEPYLVAPTQSLHQLPQAKTQRLSNYESFGDADHHRRLMQFSTVPAPAPSPVSFNQHGNNILGKLTPRLQLRCHQRTRRACKRSKGLAKCCLLLHTSFKSTHSYATATATSDTFSTLWKRVVGYLKRPDTCPDFLTTSRLSILRL